MNTATTLNALAEPSRLRIVELLDRGPLTVGEIAERLGMLQPQASKHLKVLHDAGLVEVQAAANRRIYKLRHQPLQELDEWLSTFHRVMDEKFDQLQEYLKTLKNRERERTP